MGQRYCNAAPPHTDKLDFWYDPCNPKCINWKIFDTAAQSGRHRFAAAHSDTATDEAHNTLPGFVVHLDGSHGEDMSTMYRRDLEHQNYPNVFDDDGYVTEYLNSEGLHDLSGNNHHIICTTKRWFDRENQFTGGRAARISQHPVGSTTNHIMPPFLAPQDGQKWYFETKGATVNYGQEEKHQYTTGASFNATQFNSLFFDGARSDQSRNHRQWSDADSSSYNDIFDSSGNATQLKVNTSPCDIGAMTALGNRLPLFDRYKRFEYKPKGDDGGAILPTQEMFFERGYEGDNGEIDVTIDRPSRGDTWNSTFSTPFFSNLKDRLIDFYITQNQSKVTKVDELIGQPARTVGPNNFMTNIGPGDDFDNFMSVTLSSDKDDAIWKGSYTGMIYAGETQSATLEYYTRFDYNNQEIPIYGKTDDWEVGPVLSTYDHRSTQSFSWGFGEYRPVRPAISNTSDSESLFSFGEGRNPELPLQPIGNPIVLVLTNGSFQMRNDWQVANSGTNFSSSQYTGTLGLSQHVPLGKYGIVRQAERFDRATGDENLVINGYKDPMSRGSNGRALGAGEYLPETLILNVNDFEFIDTASGYYIFVYADDGDLVRIYTRGITGRPLYSDMSPTANAQQNNTLGQGAHVDDRVASLNCVFNNPNILYMDHVDSDQEFTFLIYEEQNVVYPPVKQKAHQFPGGMLMPGNTFATAANCNIGPQRTYEKLTFTCWFKELDRSLRSKSRTAGVGEPLDTPLFQSYIDSNIEFITEFGDQHTPITTSLSDSFDQRHTILSSKYFNFGTFGTGQLFVSMSLQDSGTFPKYDTDFGFDQDSVNNNQYKVITVAKGPKVSRGNFNKWQHLAVTFDSSLDSPELTLYINGVEVHKVTSTQGCSALGENETLNASRWYMGTKAKSVSEFNQKPVRFYHDADYNSADNSLDGSAIYDGSGFDAGFNPPLGWFPAQLGCMKLWRNEALSATEIANLFESQEPRYIPRNQNYEGLPVSLVDDNTIQRRGTDSPVPLQFTSGDESVIQTNSGANQVVYTATTTLSGVTFTLESIYNYDKFSIDSSTGELTLIENPPNTEPRIGLYTVDITASKSGYVDITKTVVIYSTDAVQTPGYGAVVGGGGQGTGEGEGAGGTEPPPTVPSASNPYARILDSINTAQEENAGSVLTDSQIREAIESTDLLDSNINTQTINPRVFAIVDRGDIAESLDGATTDLASAQFRRAYFDNQISLNTLYNSGLSASFTDIPYLGYVVYSGSTFMGMMFVYFPDNADFATQPSTLSDLFTTFRNISVIGSGFGANGSISGYNPTGNFTYMPEASRNIPNGIKSAIYGIRVAIYDADDSGDEDVPTITTRTNDDQNAWVFCTRNQPNQYGYYSNSKFSLDDGVWGVHLDSMLMGNVNSYGYLNQGDNYDSSKVYAIANFNGSDTPSNDSQGTLRWNGTLDNNLKFYCFV